MSNKYNHSLKETEKRKATKEDLKVFLLENFLNEHGELDLIGIDLSDFKGNILMSSWKVGGDLFQSEHTVEGVLYQHSHIVEGDLFQSIHTVMGNLYQSEHESMDIS